MASLLNKKESPSGGFRYRQPESGEPFEGRTWRQLVKKVRPHREAMGYDTSAGWEDRLEAEVLEQNPQLEAPRTITLDDLARCANTLKNWYEAGKPLVTEAEAERRAAICVSCTQNRKVASCFGCVAAGTVLAWAVGERKTSQDDKLRQCGVCLCNLSTKLLFPLEVTDNTGLKYPDWCWAKEGAA